MRGKIVSSYIMAKPIIFSYKTLIFKHIESRKITKFKKSVPTKVLRLCTFKDTGNNLSPVTTKPNKHEVANISANFLKNLKWLYWDTQGLGGN
jgi:hypothetical protein